MELDQLSFNFYEVAFEECVYVSYELRNAVFNIFVRIHINPVFCAEREQKQKNDNNKALLVRYQRTRQEVYT